jgi:putative transposase
MKELGLKVIYPTKKIKTTLANLEHKKYPYLLRNMDIDRPNQVWSTDITYGVPGAQGKHGCLNEPQIYLKYPENTQGITVH